MTAAPQTTAIDPLHLEIIMPDLTTTDFSAYDRVTSAAIIKTQDGRILLQQRTDDAPRAPGMIVMFGGHIDPNENLVETVCRELPEELGVKVSPEELTPLGGTVRTNSRGEVALGARFFWHDVNGTITGCYEGLPAYFDSAAEALASDKLSLTTRWAVEECVARGLI